MVGRPGNEAMIPTHTGSDVCQMRSGDESWDTKLLCRGGVWKEEGLHPMLVWFVHLVYSDYQLHTVHRRSVGHGPLASPCSSQEF